MHVLFVGSHRADKQFSIVGFEHALEREFQGRLDFRTIHPRQHPALKSRNKWSVYLEKYVLFPRELRQAAQGVDLVHFCEQGVALNLPHVKSKKTLVTIHDFLAIEAAKGMSPDWKVGWAGQRYQKLIVKAVMQANGISCVSKMTRQSTDNHLFGFPGQIRTILNSTYKTVQRVPLETAQARLADRPCLEPNGFYLHIGGNKPYKNRGGVLDIYAKMLQKRPDLPQGLVMAGGGRTPELAEQEQALGLGKRVQWIQEPSDSEVEALYSMATALIFPSFAEGFGLPIVEAQMCGCPVFTTNRAPMTEVGGNAAVYFDCLDVDEAAVQVLAHQDNTERLQTLGYENAKRFAPRVMADAYEQFYQDLVKG